MISLLGIIFFALTPIYSLQYGILLPNEKLSELTTTKNNDQEEKQNDKLQLQSFSTKSELMEMNKILQHINDTGKNETEVRLNSLFILSEGEKREHINQLKNNYL